MLGPMSDTTTFSGRKVAGKRRRPKTVDGLRVCSDSSCVTRLSRYNRNGTCHVHSPIHFPRVRGRDAPVVDEA
jgi:hypothetical protein